jgi:DNA topoisomerase II
MILVNGSDGIGTGWSSKIPNYNPRQIISNIRKLIAKEPMEEMQPFYSGFIGTILPDEPGKYQVKGIIERVDGTTLHVTELPVRTWTQDFKAMLDKMLVPSGKETSAEIKDFQEFHTDTTVKFVIIAEEAKIDQWEKTPKGGLYAKFKLISSISTSNMHAFNTEHQITKYGSPEAILRSFFDLRMEYYEKRKDMLVQKLRRQQAILSNKARFVEEVCSRELVVSSRKKAELLEELKSRGYELFDDKKDGSMPSDDEEGDVEEVEKSLSELAKGYEYLLGMKIWSLTYEKAEELRAQLAERTKELHQLESTEPSTIWSKDLDDIEEALDARDEDIAEAEQDEKKAQNKTAKRQATKQKNAAAAKKRSQQKKNEWISEDEDDSDEDKDFDEVEIVKPASSNRRMPAATTSSKAPAKVLVPKSTAAAKSSAKAAPKPALKAPPKVATKPAPQPTAPVESDEDDDMEISLMDRLKKKNQKTSEESSSSESSKRPSPKSSEETSTKRAKVTKVTKKAPPKPKKKAVDSDEEAEFDFADSDSDMEVAPSAAANRSRRAVRATAKKTYADDSFLDSDDDGSDSDF